jgi:hypothetical protein
MEFCNQNVFGINLQRKKTIENNYNMGTYPNILISIRLGTHVHNVGSTASKIINLEVFSKLNNFHLL